MDRDEHLDGEESRRIVRRILGALSSLVPIGVVATDAEGRSWYHNQRWEDVTGATGLSLRGMPWYLAIHPDDIERVQDQWYRRTQIRGGVERFRVRSAFGVVQECRAESVAIVAPDGSIAGHLIVVVDGAAAQRVGLASGNLVEKLLDRSEDIVTILNADGSWRWSSAGAARLVGFQSDWDPREGIFGLIHPDELARAQEVLQELFGRRGRSAERLQFRIRGSDGTWHRMEAIADVLLDDPDVRGIVLHARDVTEAHRTMEQLEASNQWLASLLGSINAALVTMDAQGVVRFANQAFVDMFRLPMEPDQLHGRTLGSVGLDSSWLLAEPTDAIAPINEAISERRPAYRERVTLFDGRIIERDFVPVFVQDAYRGSLWLLRDVTDQARAECERERLLASERAEQRRIAELEARQSEYLASVSHELRTPLTSIVGYTEMLRELVGARGSSEEVEYVDVIARNVDRLFRLSGDLMMLESLESKMTRLELEVVHAGELTRHACEAVAPEAAARSVAVERMVAPVPPLRGDAGRLGQLLDILLSNAIKYSHPDGRVRLSVLPHNGGWRIDVSDDGIGIPPDEQKMLFSRFYRGSNARRRGIPGTGLGLSIARAVAQLHGGDIRFQSVLGKGTTVHVTLEGVPDE